MTFILVSLAVVAAIGLGTLIFDVTRLGENATDNELARTLLGVVTFSIGVVCIEPMPVVSIFSLLFCLLMTHWRYRKPVNR
jgi:hypothetical protein